MKILLAIRYVFVLPLLIFTLIATPAANSTATAELIGTDTFVFDQAFVMGQGSDVLQIADMLCRKNLLLPGKAEGRFLLRAAGQNPGHGTAEDQWLGGVAPASPQGVFLTPEHPVQRIVAAGDDVTVMQQPAIRNALQSAHRRVVVHDHRIVGQVGTGHHQRGEILHQEVMQRRIGQHHAHIAVFTYMLKPSFLLFQKDDRSAKTRKYLFLGIAYKA